MTMVIVGLFKMTPENANGRDVRVRAGAGGGGVPGVPDDVADEMAPDAGRGFVLVGDLRRGALQRQGLSTAGVPGDGARVFVREDAELADADDDSRDVEQRGAGGHRGAHGDGPGHTGTVKNDSECYGSDSIRR